MEPLTYILGGIIVAIISGVVGKTIGEIGKVKENLCTERREGCIKLFTEKIDNLGRKIDDLTGFVKNGNT